MIKNFKHFIQRFYTYKKRGVVFKYIFLKINKGYKTIFINNHQKRIKTFFNPAIYEYPISDNSYEISISPQNEILVDSYINIKNGTFIDIGAFIGKYSVKIGKRKTVQTVAIEPNPISFSILLNNLKLNNIQGNIVTINKAVSNMDGINLNFIQNYAMSRITENEKGDVLKVNTTTLSRIVKDYNLHPPFFIKIDTEGHEWQIINSFSSGLDNNIPIELVIEILPDSSYKDRIIAFLHKRNFFWERIDFTNYYFKKIL